MVRAALIREYGAIASFTDPTAVNGFYSYEMERGNDITGFWYASPGREPGKDGDPCRPEDADEFVGFKPQSREEPTE